MLFFKLKVFIKHVLKAIETILASSWAAWAGLFCWWLIFSFSSHFLPAQPATCLSEATLSPTTSTLKPAEAPDVSHLAHSKQNGTLANRLFQHLVMSETLPGALGNRVMQWIMFNYNIVISKSVWSLAFEGNKVLTHHKGYMPSLLTMKTTANVRNRRSLSFWHLQ